MRSSHFSSSSNHLILSHVHFLLSKRLVAAPAFMSPFFLAWRARSATRISSLEFAQGTFPKKEVGKGLFRTRDPWQSSVLTTRPRHSPKFKSKSKNLIQPKTSLAQKLDHINKMLNCLYSSKMIS